MLKSSSLWISLLEVLVEAGQNLYAFMTIVQRKSGEHNAAFLFGVKHCLWQAVL